MIAKNAETNGEEHIGGDQAHSGFNQGRSRPSADITSLYIWHELRLRSATAHHAPYNCIRGGTMSRRRRTRTLLFTSLLSSPLECPLIDVCDTPEGGGGRSAGKLASSRLTRLHACPWHEHFGKNSRTRRRKPSSSRSSSRVSWPLKAMAAAQITSFFQTPGANLQPSDKIIFGEFSSLHLFPRLLNRLH